MNGNIRAKEYYFCPQSQSGNQWQQVDNRVTVHCVRVQHTEIHTQVQYLCFSSGSSTTQSNCNIS